MLLPPARAACASCRTAARIASRRTVPLPPRPTPPTHFRFFSSDSPNSPSTTPSTPSEPPSSRPIPLPSPKDTPSASSTLHDARARAEKQLRALLQTVDASARKQAQAFAAALQALEIERKLREVGGRINQATGYEEIERLRSGVADKEKALLIARSRALELKKEYSERVKLRADSQREVNDLLQRKSTWNSSDVLRFTELVQQDHENEQAEARAKVAMDAGDQDVEKGFSELMQAILERYHEEQVWSDKIRSLSTYGSLAITSLNVLLFIITLILIEPWRRRKLVERVEERLRSNTQEGHDSTNAKLESFNKLLQDAQAKLDELLATTAALTPPPAPIPAPLPETAIAPSPSPQPDLDPISVPVPAPPPPPPSLATKESSPPPSPPPQRAPLPHPLLEQAREAVEGHEMVAAGAAGVAGGVALAVIISLLRGG
ncbi:hypothetical protein JCM8097_007341 [Rhodosporidiobolus ruineniae]